MTPNILLTTILIIVESRIPNLEEKKLPIWTNKQKSNLSIIRHIQHSTSKNPRAFESVRPSLLVPKPFDEGEPFQTSWLLSHSSKALAHSPSHWKSRHPLSLSLIFMLSPPAKLQPGNQNRCNKTSLQETCTLLISRMLKTNSFHGAKLHALAKKERSKPKLHEASRLCWRMLSYHTTMSE